jgi:hypothetical protein
VADNNIHDRLQQIEEQIGKFRHKLEMHGIMNRDHEVTENELIERLQVLRGRLAKQDSEHGIHKEADALELALNRWVDGTDLEYKS